ncbi:hypothetical protein [Occallatibacter savannae]|uniref:hypothetical protein n=1 Tax=Occallatibacter savannae TaxID=1002691 RepID=UPI000D686844|nr:hypothetical protein [Occallatibacter savannae]
MNEALPSMTLGPLRLGEILDKTAQIYRSRFLVFLGIATIPAGTIFVFVAGIIGLAGWIGPKVSEGLTAANAGAWAGIIVLGLLLVPATVGSTALAEAAMADAAARSFLGYPITIRESYKTAWRRGWRYIGILLLQGLAIFMGPMIFFGFAVGVMVAARVSGYNANDSSPLFGGLLFLLLVGFAAFAAWMLLRLCLAFPASVVEQTGAWNALKRSVGLSAGTKRRILVLYILGVLLNQIIAWMVMFPALILIAMIPALQGQAHARAMGTFMTFAMYGAMFVVRALTKPVFGIGLTLFYFDQRIRKEGFDIEWMMQKAGMVAVPATYTRDADDLSASLPAADHPVPVPVEAHELATIESFVMQPDPLRNSPDKSQA